MKNLNHYWSALLTSVLLLNFVSCTNAQVTGQNTSDNIEDFAVAAFNSIKNNNFDSFAILLPKAPFTLSFTDHGRQKSIAIGTNEYEQFKSNFKSQFNSIITAISMEGLSLETIRLDKIITEYDSDNNFQAVEIYLVLNTEKGRYRIRLEDCFKVNGKYFPGQLKWCGQKE